MTVMTAPRHWIAVASAEHARRGRDNLPMGFMKVGHGKCAPLKRLRTDDVVAYYAPARTMGCGFVPHRRDVRYVSAQPAPIAPLLETLDFVEDPQRWGHKFRFGLFEVSAADMQRIARAMRADTASLGWDSMGPRCAAPTDSLPWFS